MNPLLTKTHIAGAIIAPARIVKFSADNTVIQAAAATDSLMGVSVENVAAASGEVVDVIKNGIACIEFAGVVARGGPVTADADGKGVAAAPAAGVNNRIIGFAEVTTAAGDIAPILVAPGFMQGA